MESGPAGGSTERESPAHDGNKESREVEKVEREINKELEKPSPEEAKDEAEKRKNIQKGKNVISVDAGWCCSRKEKTEEKEIPLHT